ncbi:BTB/POZ domain-containing protein At3g49900 isoform X2 [Rhodamnia argentea]|uniref:BTB/POZ domain-containing protein At3g49900 isoform X2 n=1 Tax=Rhodamnia argentea TaxID=178133 RepID=A0A8B8PBR6_9MYRT|nr:BTB/POZ domain-containing protein At3g49900 isoform X2 [Rhodamnia argentea]
MELAMRQKKKKDKNWNELGVVDTIYEEEDYGQEEEDGDCSTASPPPLSSAAATPRAETSGKSGCGPDVVIRVQGTCFHLHKVPLTSRSAYLKRHLAGVSELTLSPPLKITAATFRLVADFCCGAHVEVTPSNVAELATAAASLEMAAGDGGDGGDDLRLVAETYFRQYVALSPECASALFRSCLDLLPEAETAACLVSRCVEAYGPMEDGEAAGGGDDGGVGDGFAACLDAVVTVGAEDFQATVDSMHGRLTSHDLLYRMVDVYLKEHGGKITEERKAQICNTVDCTKLSPALLLHAVQNPRMPLRFIIRAMLIEQLRTRLHVVHACDRRRPQRKKRQSKEGDTSSSAATLGAILQRDADVRCTAQLKAAMDATNSRIQSLEKELTGMRRILRESSTSEKQMSAALTDLARSASFHCVTVAESGKIERGERGSVSSGSYRFSDRGSAAAGAGGGSDWPGDGGGLGGRKSIRQRLISGLKHAFGVSRDSKPATRSKIAGENVGRDVTEVV